MRRSASVFPSGYGAIGRLRTGCVGETLDSCQREFAKGLEAVTWAEVTPVREPGR